MDEKQMMLTFSVVSLVTMGIGFYNALKKGADDRDEGDSLKAQQEEITKQLDKLNHLQALLATKAEEIQLKYLKYPSNILTSECLKEILEFTCHIVDREQLLSVYTNNRKARRTCFRSMRDQLGQGITSSLETYYRFACTFEQQLQYLIEKSQKDFVVFLNIQYSVITESIQFHTAQGENDFIEWVRTWSSQIKQQLRQIKIKLFREQLPLYVQPVPATKILEIAQYQIQALCSEGDNLKQAIIDLNLETEDEQEAIPTFLQVFLEDIIYDRYGIEIQQTNLASSQLTPELKQKFHVLSQLKSSVLQGMIDEEDEVLSESYDDEEVGDEEI